VPTGRADFSFHAVFQEILSSHTHVLLIVKRRRNRRIAFTTSSRYQRFA